MSGLGCSVADLDGEPPRNGGCETIIRASVSEALCIVGFLADDVLVLEVVRSGQA